MVVVQSNPFNQSRIATVVVAVVTSNLALAEAPGNVRIGKAESGLTRASVVNISQLVTLDREVLTQRVRALPAEVMREVDDGLRLGLGLGFEAHYSRAGLGCSEKLAIEPLRNPNEADLVYAAATMNPRRLPGQSLKHCSRTDDSSRNKTGSAARRARRSASQARPHVHLDAPVGKLASNALAIESLLRSRMLKS